MATFTDNFTGKVYRVRGTVVSQFDGKAYFSGTVLHFWGKPLSEVDFQTTENLEGWLKMMKFRG